MGVCPAHFHYAFDLPFLDGFDLRAVTLLERKRPLEDLPAVAPRL
jgi:ATP-dependent DNA ligase